MGLLPYFCLSRLTLHYLCHVASNTLWALIMASATPAASVRDKNTSAPEARGVQGLRRHFEGPQVVDTVIEANLRNARSTTKLGTPLPTISALSSVMTLKSL